jgi:hypothetical protein
MKINQSLSFLLVIFYIIGFSGCAGKPDIQFEQEFAEIGEVDEDTKTDISFTFTNTGKGPLVIRDVNPACGCTVVKDWDKTVAPGASGKIPITFNSRGYKGDVIRMIDVTTNAPDKPAIQLIVKAKVKTSIIELNPANVWLAEITPEHKELYGTFRIKANSAVPLKIEQVIPPHNIKTTFTLTAEKEHKIYKLDFIVYAPFEGSGEVEHSFVVKTNYKEKPELILPFTYKKP